MLIHTEKPRRRPLSSGALLAGVLLLLLALGEGFTLWLHQQRLDSALQAAAIRGDVPAIERLAARGANVNWHEGTPPLIVAALNYHPEAVRCLLDHGARVDIRNDRDGSTALEYALMDAQMRPVAAAATAQVLLERGADVNLACRVGESPLEWARKVDATLRRRPQFYAQANSIYLPKDLPKDAEVGMIPTAKMEASRRRLVDAILKAGNR